MGAYLSSLRGKKREEQLWREAETMLQSVSELPAGEEQLFASLRISYDALKVEQKRMFLDAAFFLLGAARRHSSARLGRVWLFLAAGTCLDCHKNC